MTLKPLRSRTCRAGDSADGDIAVKAFPKSRQVQVRAQPRWRGEHLCR